ncbi:hypothetical protein GB928_004745 [Shinella curvata]|uniref:Uncharacterized protein n=1 Tax=Shinella curvata TaxID=1817964 RepID=A0ABT8XB36_9HYPH|nr:hypothetical protein [Shinella curvata]MCJ8055118.1 hypothetical protein [Shinella curvata]MDO6120486.1 hypothetical protein [Shinella curvata]
MADLRDTLQRHLVDEKTGWSMGSFGAVAEFHQDKGEFLEADAPALFVRATRRGAIRLNAATVDRIEPVAYETLSPKPHRWSHALALCLPVKEAVGNRRNTLTELGPDENAVRSSDRQAVLFDMGLALPQCDFCIRTEDPDLLAVLRENAGRSLFDPANPAGGAVLKAHPHRVALTGIGRVEVFQKIGGPDTGGVSPPGPHTHLLPQLLKANRTHSANTPIPDHLVPLGYLHPANPVMDGMGADIDFDLDDHARFQSLYEQFARPDLPVLRKIVLDALARKMEPNDFTAPADRFGRAALRLTLRQQHRLAEKFGSATYRELVARWREVFDKVTDTAAADDDAPGH